MASRIRATGEGLGEGVGVVHTKETVASGLPSSAAASSCESYDPPQRGGESAGRSAEFMSDGVGSFLVSGPSQMSSGRLRGGEVTRRVTASPLKTLPSSCLSSEPWVEF